MLGYSYKELSTAVLAIAVGVSDRYLMQTYNIDHWEYFYHLN